ncbi:hypothetical protein GCM10007977_106930 [Dactylosporangium sucinum]|uniref:Uncharacterized protein n=1 Tax=Dactylosporangium sucinum TaxID=1424081 RepID=A0A917UEL6_9ACTN|nr:hypothetical protein GCM10007977_106930 [Dactylosporangium sucinum]
MRRRSSLRGAGMGTVVRPIGRSERAADVRPTGVPQPVQKAASGLRVRPQLAQAVVSSAPQPPQNRSPSPA